ncbi:MAG: hypothetical protein OEU68_09940, partial [Nitrospira sp.]|nr:hypothetical protein [Nitrospira sp.]MDH5318704.1 hypothetical protein [Nitrospira sp.]
GLSHTGTAERRSIYQPNRVSTESRDSDSPTVVQTHFRIGKYWSRRSAKRQNGRIVPVLISHPYCAAPSMLGEMRENHHHETIGAAVS